VQCVGHVDVLMQAASCYYLGMPGVFWGGSRTSGSACVLTRARLPGDWEPAGSARLLLLLGVGVVNAYCTLCVHIARAMPA
jgi:hypothetical protein